MTNAVDIDLKDGIVNALECQNFYNSALEVMDYNLQDLTERKELVSNQFGEANAILNQRDMQISDIKRAIEDATFEVEQTEAKLAENDAPFIENFISSAETDAKRLVAFADEETRNAVGLALLVGGCLVFSVVTKIPLLLLILGSLGVVVRHALNKPEQDRTARLNYIQQTKDNIQELKQNLEAVMNDKKGEDDEWEAINNEYNSLIELCDKQEQQVVSFKEAFNEGLRKGDYALALFPETFRFGNSYRLEHALQIVLDGAATDWTTVAQLVRSEEDTNKIVDSVNALGGALGQSLQAISERITDSTNKLLDSSMQVIEAVDNNSKVIQKQGETIGTLIQENTHAVNEQGQRITGAVETQGALITGAVIGQGNRITQATYAQNGEIEHAANGVRRAVNAQTLTGVLGRYNGAVLSASADTLKNKQPLDHYDEKLLKKL